MKIQIKNLLLSGFFGFLAGICNGLLGSGGGTIVVPFMTEILKIETKKAHASAILVILVFTMISLFFYGRNSFLNYEIALWVSIGGVLGGYVGAKLLSKLPAQIIQKTFGVFMIIAAFKMVTK